MAKAPAGVTGPRVQMKKPFASKSIRIVVLASSVKAAPVGLLIKQTSHAFAATVVTEAEMVVLVCTSDALLSKPRTPVSDSAPARMDWFVLHEITTLLAPLAGLSSV